MKAGDHFETPKEFDDMIEQAEMNASTGWEVDFVSDMRERFDQYALESFLSEPQLTILQKIADGQSVLHRWAE